MEYSYDHDCLYRGPLRAAAYVRLSTKALRDHCNRMVFRLAGPGHDDVHAGHHQSRIRPHFDANGPVGQLEFRRHVPRCGHRRHACRQVRSQTGFPAEHDFLGRRESLVWLRPERRTADVVPGFAWLRHGHGISHRAFAGFGNRAGQESWPLHRHSRRVLAAGLHLCGCDCLLLHANNRLARHFHRLGVPGPVRIHRASLCAGIAALVGRGRAQ